MTDIEKNELNLNYPNVPIIHIGNPQVKKKLSFDDEALRKDFYESQNGYTKISPEKVKNRANSCTILKDNSIELIDFRSNAFDDNTITPNHNAINDTSLENDKADDSNEAIKIEINGHHNGIEIDNCDPKTIEKYESNGIHDLNHQYANNVSDNHITIEEEVPAVVISNQNGFTTQTDNCINDKNGINDDMNENNDCSTVTTNTNDIDEKDVHEALVSCKKKTAEARRSFFKESKNTITRENNIQILE